SSEGGTTDVAAATRTQVTAVQRRRSRTKPSGHIVRDVNSALANVTSSTDPLTASPSDGENANSRLRQPDTLFGRHITRVESSATTKPDDPDGRGPRLTTRPLHSPLCG